MVATRGTSVRSSRSGSVWMERGPGYGWQGYSGGIAGEAVREPRAEA